MLLSVVDIKPSICDTIKFYLVTVFDLSLLTIEEVSVSIKSSKFEFTDISFEIRSDFADDLKLLILVMNELKGLNLLSNVFFDESNLPSIE